MTHKVKFLFLFEVVFFFCFYIVPPLQLYNHFQLQNFDYGILFQATRLLAEGKPLFLTTRGVHALADNQEWLQFVFSFAHFLPNPHYGLLLFHSVAIFSTGLVLFWLFRRDSLLSIVLPTFVWLSPLLINMNLDVLHTESLATVLIVFMFAAARGGNTTGFIICEALALMCKEDVAITVGTFCALGYLQPKYFKLPRAIFSCGFVAALGLFFVNLLVVLPHFKLLTCQWLDPNFTAASLDAAPVAPFFRKVFSNLENPEFFWERLARLDVGYYLLRLLWPVLLFLPRPSIFWLLPIPAMLINVLADTDYLIQGFYHYDHSTFAAVVIAVCLSWEESKHKNICAALLVCIPLLQHIGPQSGLRANVLQMLAPEFWSLKKHERVEFLEKLNAVLPADVVISADYTSLNYVLSGHDHVYMFENPFLRRSFGIYGLCESLAYTPAVDILVIRDDYQIKPDISPIVQNLFSESLHKNGVRVFLNRYSSRTSTLDELLHALP